MAEYIKRDSVIKWIETTLKVLDDRWSLGQKNMFGLFRSAVENNVICPTADVVEVVRCRDCKFFEPDTYSDYWCSAKISGVSKGMFSPSGDSYCSDAVKRGKKEGSDGE